MGAPPRNAVTRRSKRTLRVALCGLGAVGRTFLELWQENRSRLAREEGLVLRFTGVATRGGGARMRHSGFEPRVLLRPRWERTVGAVREERPRQGEPTLEWIRCVPADVLIETTPLSPRTGQPALTYVETALRRGLHVVTANKGPVAWGFQTLQRLSRATGAQLYFEGTVMDGVPLFSLRNEALAGSRVLSFRGVVNSTVHYLLQEVERGRSVAAAIADMQRLGIAEADPRHDLYGWDAALKVSVLATALLGKPLKPDGVGRRGIQHLGESAIRRAASEQRPWRLVAEAGLRRGRVWGRVGPQRLDSEDPLARLRGTSNAVTLVTDPLGPITIVEDDPGVRQTASAVLMDLVRLGRALRGEDRRSGSANSSKRAGAARRAGLGRTRC